MATRDSMCVTAAVMTNGRLLITFKRFYLHVTSFVFTSPRPVADVHCIQHATAVKYARLSFQVPSDSTFFLSVPLHARYCNVKGRQPFTQPTSRSQPSSILTATIHQHPHSHTHHPPTLSHQPHSQPPSTHTHSHHPPTHTATIHPHPHSQPPSTHTHCHHPPTSTLTATIHPLSAIIHPHPQP